MSVGTPKSHLRDLRDQLVDIAVDRYIDWREHARTAEAAYERWTKAPSHNARSRSARTERHWTTKNTRRGTTRLRSKPWNTR
jgi:hypothetical protein